MRRAQAGFTLVELLVVLAVLSIVSAIAAVNLQDAYYRGRAVKIIEDVNAIKVAAFQYYTDHGRFPRDVDGGRPPEGLETYLGGRVRWVMSDYSYDWDLWIRPDGDPAHPATGVLIGVSFLTENPKLRASVLRVYRGPILQTLSQSTTFVIEPYRP
ncbi:MAG TPA: prepilin-type N-terminal cleavage/methylation domain-containing protein [Candidatus Polarisedimenticolaceae bacterium]